MDPKLSKIFLHKEEVSVFWVKSKKLPKITFPEPYGVWNLFCIADIPAYLQAAIGSIFYNNHIDCWIVILPDTTEGIGVQSVLKLSSEKMIKFNKATPILDILVEISKLRDEAIKNLKEYEFYNAAQPATFDHLPHIPSMEKVESSRIAIAIQFTELKDHILELLDPGRSYKMYGVNIQQ